MKIQKEIILRKEALAAIVEDYMRRQSPEMSIKVRFAGFECNRRQMPENIEKATRFVLVVDEVAENDEYSPYQGIEYDSITPDIPTEPTTHSPVKSGSGSKRKPTQPEGE